MNGIKGKRKRKKERKVEWRGGLYGDNKASEQKK
jgi:hypothetical protein